MAACLTLYFTLVEMADTGRIAAGRVNRLSFDSNAPALAAKQPPDRASVLSVLMSMVSAQTLSQPWTTPWSGGCPNWRPGRYRAPVLSPMEAPPVRSLPRFLFALMLALLLLADGVRIPVDAAPPSGSGATDIWTQPHVAGELLVGFRDAQPFGTGSFTASFDRYLVANDIVASSIAFGDRRTYRFNFAADDDLVARRAALLRDPRVAFVEPNYYLSIQSMPTGPLKPNDEKYDQQWAMPKIGADVAWNTLTTGGPIVVAVLDTGASPPIPS